VYPLNAQGDTPPLRVIKGPKTQLNWATALALHPDRGELFVANDVGDSVAVFRMDAEGDAAPIRTLKGPRSLIKNPTSVAVDLKNNELWVSNFGNHSATVYPIDAKGDAPPLRVIRSAPVETQSPMLSNPHVAVFDTKRKEILVAN
jgi:DNA-binding beta-propeller fold protein YncE